MRSLLLLLFAAASLAAPLLSGDTSHPDTSLYQAGERMTLTFGVSGATAPLTLQISVEDERERVVARHELAVTPDAAGNWRGELEAPAERLGFYRVRARLSDGTTGPKLGTRAPGYLTYAVVPPARQRVLYPAEETFFGMQGGFNPNLNVPALLGVRWILGGYRWDRTEPERAGQFDGRPPTPKPSNWQVDGEPWVTYPLPCIYNPPKWAVVPETVSYSTGTLSPAGEQAWAEYCRAVGRAFAAERPDLARRLYQITWEPVYPWGFKGTDEDLIRIHEIAFEALHEADPRAWVIGPTGAGISADDVEWNARLLGKGLARYLDGLAIHPYHPMPPEANGLVDHVRALREVVRQTTGRDLPIYGTEQGWATGEDPARELAQAQGLLRANLIMMGEGLQHNFAFYASDYHTELGYGYFYNLNPKMPWGTDKVAPKPVAPGYAAQSLLLEGHRSAGAIEWLGETALGYAYERGDSVVLALWDYGDQPREVSLPVGAEQVVVSDWMGNPRSLDCPGEVISTAKSGVPVKSPFQSKSAGILP
ncbi:MAG: hypothetical protein HUU35_12620, partial [Armatimonadetes bacterium]|nr:hypothetical protein [Armatimonadota bacterium]